MIEKLLCIVGLIIVIPFFIYFCFKAGSLGYYKAKQFVEKEDKQ